MNIFKCLHLNNSKNIYKNVCNASKMVIREIYIIAYIEKKLE